MLRCYQLEGALLLAIPPHAVHVVQTVKLVTAVVVMIAMYSMNAVLMLAALKVNYNIITLAWE